MPASVLLQETSQRDRPVVKEWVRFRKNAQYVREIEFRVGNIKMGAGRLLPKRSLRRGVDVGCYGKELCRQATLISDCRSNEGEYIEIGRGRKHGRLLAELSTLA